MALFSLWQFDRGRTKNVLGGAGGMGFAGGGGDSIWGDLGLGGTLGLAFGPGILNALGSLFGGASQSQKSSRNVFNMARGQMGKKVFDPNAIFGNLQQGLAPQFNLDALNVSKRLGLSSGVAQGELAQNRQSMLSQLFGNIQMQSLQAQSQRDMELMRIMMGAAQTS